jgi:hypothetical protein
VPVLSTKSTWSHVWSGVVVAKQHSGGGNIINIITVSLVKLHAWPMGPGVTCPFTHYLISECMIIVVVYIREVVPSLPMPHISQRTISFGLSESSFLHLMHIISVVVSSTGGEREL